MSTITEWRYIVALASSDEALGNQLYSILRAFQHDPAPTESIFNHALNASWKGAELVGKAALHDAIQEYNSGGYPQLLLDAGMTKAYIDALRPVIKIDSYDLYASGERVVNTSFFNDFVSSLNIN